MRCPPSSISARPWYRMIAECYAVVFTLALYKKAFCCAGPTLSVKIWCYLKLKAKCLRSRCQRNRYRSGAAPATRAVGKTIFYCKPFSTGPRGTVRRRVLLRVGTWWSHSSRRGIPAPVVGPVECMRHAKGDPGTARIREAPRLVAGSLCERSLQGVFVGSTRARAPYGGLDAQRRDRQSGSPDGKRAADRDRTG